jgi:anthranilate phosphoribosyltransferase
VTHPGDAPDPASAAFALAEHGGWPGLLTKLLEGRDLSAAQSRAAMNTILSGHATAAQLIAFVVALRAKGETAEELSGMLDAVLAHAELVPLGDGLRARAVDIVGTGGDRSHSINVSTMAALVTAGAGVPVCKHGARGSSSQCGTADVLEALGVAIELTPAGVLRCVTEAGFGFCFAPRFHPAFRFAGPSRREIGIPTVFNLLGPMANPGQVRRQLIGVADADFAARMLASVRAHGSTDAWIVHGGGLDELTTTGPSTVLALRHDGGAETFTVDPVALGLAPSTMEALVGGPPAHNAEVVRRVLGGEHGPHRDIVVLNAAAALVVAGVATDLTAGLELAAGSIDDGRAAAVLARVIDVSNRPGSEHRPP